MRPSLKALRSRAAQKAQAAAAGASPPAGQEPPPAAALTRPGAVERGNMRRRLRRARRMREALLTELGALVMEMHRQRRHDAALVERKAREASVADRQAAGLARALDQGQTLGQVVSAGIAGSCRVCRALLATDDRFCARCGTPVAGRLAPPTGAPVAGVPAPPPSAADRIAVPPPSAADRVAAPTPPPGVDKVLPPPSAADRIQDPTASPAPPPAGTTPQ